MATSTYETFRDDGIGVWVKGASWRLAGLGLVLAGLFVVTALLGYDPRDPSLNSVTRAPPGNLAGASGAIVADLLVQFFGGAAWLLPVSLIGWGLRLGLRRPLAWPWLPPLALPLALMAFAAFLAQLGTVGGGRSGGHVGVLLWDRIEPTLGAWGFFWGSFATAVLLVVASLGLRWGSSVRTAGRVGILSLEAGRRLRRIAGGQQQPPEPDGEAELPRSFRRRSADPDPEAMDDEPIVPTPRRRRPPRDRTKAAAATPAEPVKDGEEMVVVPRLAQRPAPQPTSNEDGFELPPLDLLTPVKHTGQLGFTRTALDETSRQLETVLDDFGVRGQITGAKPGPVVTLHELEPAPGTRAARVVSLADDIARSLCAVSVRVATVPGRNVIGIELPNEKRETVFLRELMQAESYVTSGARLPLTLGKDIAGNPIVVDLARMPHLLIAGTTGSGKSVAINAMILSLLYRLTPDQLRIIMIDPKVIELSVYEDIPHLLSPVVTEPHKAVVALKWIVRQMDERYRLMAHLGVRDIFAFNRRIAQAREAGEELKRRVRTGFEPGTGVPIYEDQPIESTPMPLIVVIVDEVADLMMTAGKEIENAIQRLSQKARAAGIHLIVATQRPSVDVLTGVIKANLPSRISFRVSSKIDSRTILGEPGAEQLLGQGDMLHLMPGDRIARIHGPLVTDAEVERVVRHLKAQGEPDYVDAVTHENDDEPQADGPLFEVGAAAGGGDGLYSQAVQIVQRDGKASTSYLQRKLTIGYNNAAKLIERMENDGIISTADHVGRRQVLRRREGAEVEDEAPF